MVRKQASHYASILMIILAILCAIFRQQMIQDCILNATNDESALYGAVKAGTDSGTTNTVAAGSKPTTRGAGSTGTPDACAL